MADLSVFVSVGVLVAILDRTMALSLHHQAEVMLVQKFDGAWNLMSIYSLYRD